MKILAIELAVEAGCVAVVDTDDSGVTHMETWTAPRARHEGVIGAIDRLRRDTGFAWDNLDLIAAGRGPGAFSGVRMALLTAQFLARPGGTRFRAVSSMEAAARAWLAAHGGDRATVVGDARRGHLWLGTATLDPDAPPCAWSLTGQEHLPRLLDEHPVLLTPHRDRLTTLCPGREADRLQALVPDASATAALARLREDRGAPGEPPVPLYLHPAV